MTECRLHYDESLLRQAVRAFVVRSLIRGLGVSFFVAVAVLAAFEVYLVVTGDRGWFVGLIAGLFVFVGAALVTVYVAHLRNAIGTFRRMRVPEATLTCAEDEFTVSSELGSATLPWSSIAEVWRYPRFWLILYSRSQFSTLPLADLGPEAQAFITRKTQHAGPTT